MTVSTTTSRIDYSGNGVTTLFTVPFPFIADSYLTVLRVNTTTLATTTLTLDSVGADGYSVTGAGEASGSITVITAPTASERISIIRAVPETQDADFVANDPLPAETFEDALDKLTMIVQQVSEIADRAVLLPTAVVNVSNELPIPESLKFLQWRADGLALQNAEAASGGDPFLRSDLASTAGAGLVGYQLATGGLSTVQVMVREKLMAARTYYVRTDGSDSNSGLDNTSIGAFLTLQKAANVIADTLDLNGFNVTVNVADGTYTAGVTLSNPFVGDGIVYFTGNTTTPANCVVNATGDAFYGEKGVTFDVRGFKVTATNRGIVAQTGAFISVGQMDFGACTGAQVEIGTQGQIQLGTNYSITGGAASHLHASGPGLIFAGTITVTLTGTPAFVNYFAGAAQGSIVVKEVTYSGAATGTRFLSHKGATIETNPAFNPALPGNAEGRTWGGIYVGSTSVPLRYQANPTSSASLQIQGFRGISQAFVTHFECVTDPGGESIGYLYATGDDSYSSGRTQLGTKIRVIASSGTDDGMTVEAGGQATISRTSDVALYTRRQGTDGDTVRFYKNTTFSGSISVSAGATAYNTSSDERIKTWIGGGYDANWIVRVAAEVGEFTFKSDKDGVVHTGVRAQRLAEIEPLAVTPGHGMPGDDDFIPHGVDYSKLIPKLLLEVAELRRRLDGVN
jgi:hypothetical protein